MNGLPAVRPNRLKRTVLLFAVGTLVAGASMLPATAAYANVGTEEGEITFLPITGPTTTTGVSYSTATACPSGYQGSAVVGIPDPVTGAVFNLSPVNDNVASPFSGPFNTTFALAEQAVPDIAGVGAEVVAYCFSGAGATGTSTPVQYTFVIFSADGSSYSYSANRSIYSVTDLSVSPNPAAVGQTVTLTATVTPSYAPGSVQFYVGGTARGSPVTLINGVATTTMSFALAGTEPLSAIYTPAPNAEWGSSVGNVTLQVGSSTTVPVGSVGLIGLAALVGCALFLIQRRRAGMS